MSQSNSAAGRLGALNDLFTLGVIGQATVAIQISGSYSGTISFLGSIDGATVAVLATPTGSTTAVTTTMSTGIWQANCAGLQTVTAKMTGYSSGAATVTMVAVTSGGGTSSGGGAGPSGPVTIADGADDAEGATTDAKKFDEDGTVNAHVRAVAAVEGDVWDSVNHWMKVGVMNTPTVTVAAGSALIGKVSIDQTTPGSTNGVQVNAALPAGSNVIGHVIADSGSTTAVTGNVTVVQPTGTSLHAVIDSGSTTAVTGNVTAVQPTGTNLHTVLDSGTLTTVTTVTTVSTVTAVTAITNALPAGSNTIGNVNPGTAANWGVYVEDAPETAGGNLMMAGNVRRDTLASSSGTTGDNSTFNTNRDGALWVTGAAGPSGGWSVATGSIGNTKTDIGSANTAGQVGGWYFFNANTSTAYVQFFNTQASGVTLGTTPPVYSLGIPALGAANVAPGMVGIAHATAISIAITTSRAGSTNTASTVDYNLWFKQ